MIRNLLKAANALTFSTMFLLLLAGCNKNTIIFEDGTTPNGSSGNEDPGNSTLVTFNASVEGRNLLRSMSPMNKGIQQGLCLRQQRRNQGKPRGVRSLHNLISRGVNRK